MVKEKMFVNMDFARLEALYAAQEEVYSLVREALGTDFQFVKLIGGTVLARCYLRHRVSFDLDFALMPGKGVELNKFCDKLEKNNFGFKVQRFQINENIYSQLFGQVPCGDKFVVEISFFEDRWFEKFPSISQNMGNIEIVTEPVDGLYHRKVRTVAGFGEDDTSRGGRQKKRDIFDLYVLSKKIKPLLVFLEEMPLPFNKEGFFNGLSSMDWTKMLLQKDALFVSEEWSNFQNLENIIEGIMDEADLKKVQIPDIVTVGPEEAAKWIFDNALNPRLDNLEKIFNNLDFAKNVHKILHDIVNNPDEFGYSSDLIVAWGKDHGIGRIIFPPSGKSKTIYNNF